MKMPMYRSIYTFLAIQSVVWATGGCLFAYEWNARRTARKELNGFSTAFGGSCTSSHGWCNLTIDHINYGDSPPYFKFELGNWIYLKLKKDKKLIFHSFHFITAHVPVEDRNRMACTQAQLVFYDYRLNNYGVKNITVRSYQEYRLSHFYRQDARRVRAPAANPFLHTQTIEAINITCIRIDGDLKGRVTVIHEIQAHSTGRGCHYNVQHQGPWIHHNSRNERIYVVMDIQNVTYYKSIEPVPSNVIGFYMCVMEWQEQPIEAYVEWDIRSRKAHHCIRSHMNPQETLLLRQVTELTIGNSPDIFSEEGPFDCYAEHYADPFFIMVRYPLESTYRKCPFPLRRYAARVLKEDGKIFCLDKRSSHVTILDDGRLAVRTCLDNDSYEEPFVSDLRCHGELNPELFGSVKALGEAVIVSHTPQHRPIEYTSFYTARYIINRDDSIKLTLLGNINGGIHPYSGDYHAPEYFRQGRFAVKLFLQPLCYGINCYNGGTCQDGFCNCVSGYTGTSCESEDDECMFQPCHYQGHCHDSFDNFTCECYFGYTGILCETVIPFGVVIYGYTGPLLEGNVLELQCMVDYLYDMFFSWAFTSEETKLKEVISRNQNYSKNNLRVSDAGIYECRVNRGSYEEIYRIPVTVLENARSNGSDIGKRSISEEKPGEEGRKESLKGVEERMEGDEEDAVEAGKGGEKGAVVGSEGGEGAEEGEDGGKEPRNGSDGEDETTGEREAGEDSNEGEISAGPRAQALEGNDVGLFVAALVELSIIIILVIVVIVLVVQERKRNTVEAVGNEDKADFHEMQQTPTFD